MDMLRYHRFTGGAAWVPSMARRSTRRTSPILQVLPLHNVVAGVLSATLVTTADHDDRVVPATFKFAADAGARVREPIRSDRDAARTAIARPTSGSPSSPMSGRSRWRT
jgi:prolyl oligopeptidase PreP (S9A serine peptidase family)